MNNDARTADMMTPSSSPSDDAIREDAEHDSTTRAQEQQALTVARRVHRRLTRNTPVQALPRVLQKLLPRLLQHVDRIQKELVYTSSGRSDVLPLVQQQHAASIAYGREQLQQQSTGDNDDEDDDAAALALQALAEEILLSVANVWYSPITMMLGLSLLPPTNSTSLFLSLLLRTWNTIETKLLLEQPQTQHDNAAANPTLHSVWLRLSWMVLDTLVLQDDTQQRVEDDANKAFFQLILDVVLFPGCCSRVGHARLQEYPGGLAAVRNALRSIVLSAPWRGTERGRLFSVLSSPVTTTTTTECSVPLATALLTLIVGEGSDVAIAASDDNDNMDTSILGSASRRRHYAWCRPRLPAPQPVLDFLLASFWPSDGSGTGYYALLDMILEASTLDTATSWFPLAERVLRALPSKHATVRKRWTEQFNQKVCDKTLQLLFVVVDHDDDTFDVSTPPEDGRRRQPPSHRENTIQLYQANRRQQLTMPARCAAYDLWTAILDAGLTEESMIQDQLLPNFLHCIAYEFDSVLQPYALRTLDRCCQRVQSTNAILSARLVAVLCASSARVRTAAATTWIGALLLANDKEAALHLWQHLHNDDPSPEVRAAAAQALANITPQEEEAASAAQQESSSLPGPIYLDRSNEMDMHVLLGEWQRTIESVAARFGLHKDVCLLLLVAAQYDTTTVVKALENDRDTTLRQYGIVLENSVQHQPFSSCGICFDDTVLYSACPKEHRFCCRCWREYLNVTCQGALKQGSNFTCPMPDCQVCVSPMLMRSVDPVFTVQWETSVFEKFLAASQSLSTCPTENCSGITMLLSGDTTRRVTCSLCHAAYCFQCGSEPHHPASCFAYKKWTQHVAHTSDSSFWVRMNSKPCPQCSVPIEKNTGCNHMVCTQCGIHFCWLCLAELPSHLAPHQCNSVVFGTALEQRAQFYTTRFHDHVDARFFESNRNGKFEQLSFLDEHDRVAIEEACEVLSQARTYLAFSCIAAWEMSQDESTIRNEDGVFRLQVVPGSRLEAFMNAQSTLALLAEQLSSMTESKISLEKAYRLGGPSDVTLALRSMSFVADTISKYTARMFNLCHNRQHRGQASNKHHNEE